jgi:release factor glutamine methyltransferase
VRIKEALDFGAKQLKKYPNPRKEAALLLGFLLKKDRKWLLLNENELLKEDVKFFELVKKRVGGEPLEYILQEVSFYSKSFKINKGVLIPRPETELLVDEALKIVQSIQNPNIVEVGTGSGVIAIMLALLKPDAKIVATDISIKALANAKENAILHNVQDKITFVHCEYLDSVVGNFDLLVSNPPYISSRAVLEEHVLREPHEALFGGQIGTEVLCTLIQKANKAFVKAIACEMGYDQKEFMRLALEAIGAKEIHFYKDLAGLDRGFSAKLRE